MTYILKNIQCFATKSTMVFVLFVLCEIASVFSILFAHGSYNNFQREKFTEKQYIDYLNNSLDISFGNIIEAFTDEKGNVSSYNCDSAITVKQIQQFLGNIEGKECKSVGFAFEIENNDESCMKYNKSSDIEQSMPMTYFRFDYDEKLKYFSIYDEFLKNVIISDGRYFTKEEYVSDENIVVMPADSDRTLLNKEIDLFGKKYRVIGFFKQDNYLEVPIKTLDGNLKIKYINILNNDVLTSKMYYEIRDELRKVVNVDVNMTPLKSLDLYEMKFFDSMIYLSIAIAVASAINLAILFRYILNLRRKQFAIFLIMGSTKNKIRRMYVFEILIISVIIFLICILTYNYIFIPNLAKFLKYISSAYDFKTYIAMFGIYISAIYIFINIAIISSLCKSPIELLKERGK